MASVHKPLVSASRMCKKGLMVLMEDHGGNVIESRGALAMKIKKLVKEEFQWSPSSNVIPLYLENGVYNFHVQDEAGEWKKYNVDSGAAETVLPMNAMEDKEEMENEKHVRFEDKLPGGPRQVPRRP